MKLVRREPPEIGISFLDTITCGIGAIKSHVQLVDRHHTVAVTPSPLSQEARSSHRSDAH